MSATPRPWHWQEGWTEYKLHEVDSYEHEKYLDLGLSGPQGQEILPLRVDHYESMIDFDPSEREPISRADRDLIVRAVNSFDELLAACKEFVRKVECGEARSIRSYQQMKAAIAKAEKP